ncbi:MAG: threonylcarbamoyl-AMP synthase [Nanohaloarchaea archaeon SW_7_46_7]|nr:MAG: threonylcarbamoyl-AMP synthase [Nanohaloarchaea archaeon SW_7_46_7]
MSTEISGDQIEKAKKVIENGGLVVFPTETAYGIAADATNAFAVEKVYDVKNRPKSKGLTTIVDSLETAEEYGNLSEEERKVIQEFMPGPLTLVTNKGEGLPPTLNDDFVFRVSSGEVASKLSEVGPITATSANISGEETSYSISSISDKLLDEVDFVLDAGELEASETSSIVEINNGEVEVHREGPVTEAELRKALK